MRVLLGCVGNVLRRDDGFGVAVAARLGERKLRPEVEIVETGIGGMALLQQLMSGYDGLVLVDAVDRGVVPGTVFVIDPEIGEAEHVADVHLANPERVLAMAKAIGVLPPRVQVVGCQPAHANELGEGLSPEVERAVAAAVEEVEGILATWTGGDGE